MYRRFDQPFTFDSVVRLIISVLLTAFGIYVIYTLRSVLLPFLIAWLIAYILNPVVRFLQNRARIRNRIAAVVVTLLLVAGVIALIAFILKPMIETEVYHINMLIQDYEFISFSSEIRNTPPVIHEFISQYIDFNSLKEVFSKENAADTVQRYIIPSFSGFVSSTISILVGLTVVFLILLYLIFILIDYDKINQLWQNLIPVKYRPFVNSITLDIEKSMNTYFRHQFLICLILSALYVIGFQTIGLPLAIIFGIFVGLLHMIPYFQIISFPPVVLLCWLKTAQTDVSFWGMIGLVIIVYLTVQCIMDLYLVPRIMGKAMGLNPAIILLSLSIWGYLMGIVGMIIAIPLTTLLLSYYQSFLSTLSQPDEVVQVDEPKENDGQ